MFIKQVPDTEDIKWTANNNIDRTNMDSIMNPVDKQAIEAALRIKEQNNAEITAVTMGPSKAVDVLKEAVAMGVDNAALLCDSKFAGSDTLATSKVLCAAIKEKFPNTNLIMFGQSAIDGETSQTGPNVAVRLNLPFICRVNEILEINNEYITVNSENDNYKYTYKLNLPAVICINNYIFKPRLPRINGYINSQKYFYKSYNMFELNLSDCDTGIKGSPTYVSKVYRKDDKRNCKFVENAQELASALKEE